MMHGVVPAQLPPGRPNPRTLFFAKESGMSCSTSRRYQLNKIVVDTEAGPQRNRTVLFLGSSRGTILKFLIVPNQDNTVTNSNIFLEELEGFNPDKYDGWWILCACVCVCFHA